jgi:hypothetical protein
VLRIESDYFGDMYACFLFSIPNFGRFALAQTCQPFYGAIVTLEFELARPPHQMDIMVMREKVAELRRIWFATFRNSVQTVINFFNRFNLIIIL